MSRKFKKAVKQVEEMEREFDLKPPTRFDGETDGNYLTRRASAVQTYCARERARLQDTLDYLDRR